jgi:hypothetical protein
MLSNLLLVVLLARADDSAASRTNVNLVLAPVTLTDRRAAIVNGLSRENFAVLEDKRPERIVSLCIQDAPRSVGINSQRQVEACGAPSRCASYPPRPFPDLDSLCSSCSELRFQGESNSLPRTAHNVLMVLGKSAI